MDQQKTDYDFIVIGSGFGGSVSAMRLAQKGYRVAILEAGRRLGALDFARSNWNLRRYLWLPRLGCHGPQRITLLRGVMVLSGAGVGGGSLIYANTLMQPDPAVFADPLWPAPVRWWDELEPHYYEAAKMLGRTSNMHLSAADRALQRVAGCMNAADTYKPVDVAVYFGKPGETHPDPYFDGQGPSRAGCTLCGGCMIGCRHNAKNTLDKNYLHFAEAWGAVILAETTVHNLLPVDGGKGGFVVEGETSLPAGPKKRFRLRAGKVVVAAGALGTTDLLLRCRDIHRSLPDLSSMLGRRVRTNGESLVGATSFESRQDYSHGIAIGASFRPDAHTKIEAVRYPSGSGALRVLGLPLTPDGSRLIRPLKFIARLLLRLPRVLRLYFGIRDWARHSVILLVMQTTAHEMELTLRRSLWRGFRKRLSGNATAGRLPSYLPVAQEAARHLAHEVNGEAQNVAPEVLMATTVTAHVLGGACIGKDAGSGVIDESHAVFHYPNLYICDGSVIPNNLGVNPSLTIAALAERFASRFPPRSMDGPPRSVSYNQRFAGEPHDSK